MMNALVIGLVIIALLGGFFAFFYRSMHISETLTYSLMAVIVALGISAPFLYPETMKTALVEEIQQTIEQHTFDAPQSINIVVPEENIAITIEESEGTTIEETIVQPFIFMQDSYSYVEKIGRGHYNVNTSYTVDMPQPHITTTHQGETITVTQQPVQPNIHQLNSMLTENVLYPTLLEGELIYTVPTNTNVTINGKSPADYAADTSESITIP